MQPLTITAFARVHGLSRATLLYYDRIGLLEPAGVSPAGYRLYGAHEAERMSRIRTFRDAGIPLKAIREILDGERTDVLETALEERLVSLNKEIHLLRSQQRIIAGLLQGEEGRQLCSVSVDVEQWVAMLEEAGVDEAGRIRWHQAFERDAPEAHHEFLLSLGLDEATIEKIRHRSRDGA